jgi:hypothetical protein
MLKRLTMIAFAAALTMGCATILVDLGGPKVTVLKVLEDSRCPMEARCVWAGQVRTQVRIELGSGTSVKELISNQPLPVADGSLELLGVMPPRSTQTTIKPRDYRFALKFSGGL